MAVQNVSYTGSRLKDKDISPKCRDRVKHALPRKVQNDPYGRLVGWLKQSLPQDVNREIQDKNEVLVEVLAKLLYEACTGPLKIHPKDTSLSLQAQRFLNSVEGIEWMSALFQPHEPSFVRMGNKDSENPAQIHPVDMVARTESYDPASKPVRACAPAPASAPAPVPSPAVAHDHAIGHIVNIREQRVDHNEQALDSPHQSAADPLIKGDSSDFLNPAQHRKQGVFLLVALAAVSAIFAGLIGPTMIGN